jgi:hypothetical protein
MRRACLSVVSTCATGGETIACEDGQGSGKQCQMYHRVLEDDVAAPAAPRAQHRGRAHRPRASVYGNSLRLGCSRLCSRDARGLLLSRPPWQRCVPGRQPTSGCPSPTIRAGLRLCAWRQTAIQVADGGPQLQEQQLMRWQSDHRCFGRHHFFGCMPCHPNPSTAPPSTVLSIFFMFPSSLKRNRVGVQDRHG